MAHPTPTQNIVIDITGSSSGANEDDALNSRINNNRRRLLICVGLVFTLSEIVASVVVLSLSSKHEHPPGPLFIWIAVYASFCAATLPLFCTRYYHNSPSWFRLELEEFFKIVLGYIFFVWFVSGIVIILIFGGQSSEAPSLHWLFKVFLAFTLIRCAIGVRDTLKTQIQGATTELINGLPTYKFKKNKKINNSTTVVDEGGVIAAGTQKESMISGEDAVCCICLAKYENNDELRELLPCSHLFHKECVDMWLEIKALCPICKSHVT